MRGRQYTKRRDKAQRRNTPAYAGKTNVVLYPTRAGRKHPRVCGEDDDASAVTGIVMETPPRMRGRPVEIKASQAVKGNTPAYAGKTDHHDYIGVLLEKHPRVCGEDYSSAVPLLYPSGNTPAYAGKTLPSLSRGCASGKHPRVCGEDAT